MKLFWKIFLAVTTVTTAVFCVSGHILIYAFFHTSLENELRMQANLNLSFCRMFEASLTRSIGNAEPSQTNVINAAEAAKSSKDARRRIFGTDGRVYFDSEARAQGDGTDLEFLRNAGQKTAAYRVERTGTKYLLCLADYRELPAFEYYAESVSDVTQIFRQKEWQYRIYSGFMFGLIAVTGLTALILTRWIVRPIRRLSKAAQEIGKGDYSKQIPVRGNDEMAELAREFNRMTQKVQGSIRGLEDAARRQEEFVSSFSHELKTPLTSIVGYSDMLRSKQMSEEERMIYGDYIFRQGKRLELLARKMLELTVLKNTEFPMRKIPLAHIFETLAQELAPLLEQKQLALHWSAGDTCILAEPDLLKTVFVNLIDNSVKACGEHGEIWINAAAAGEQTVVTVTDNGKGIPKKDIPRVTESFYMADKSRKHQGGVGLGLSICLEILKLHQAQIEIASRENTGTIVTLTFGRTS